MSDKQSFFDGMHSKASFFLGLFIGIACVSVIALFAVLLGDAGKNSLVAAEQVDNQVAQEDSGNDKNVAAPSANLPAVNDSDHIRGDSNASVTIVEYSDFECPFCGRFHPTMQRVMEEYKGKVQWVYRHFPLSFHRDAQPAAEAAECAAEQGKFWEFADTMFANQESLGESLYTETAQNLGLDMSKFNDCVDSGKYAGKIKQQMSGGASAGVKGTPATFINGEMVSGAVPFETIKKVIDSKL